MFYTYILQLDDKSYYIGYSTNLKQRILYHKKHLVGSTKNHKTIDLVYYSAFKDKSKAVKFERYLKEGSGFAFRNKHLV